MNFFCCRNNPCNIETWPVILIQVFFASPDRIIYVAYYIIFTTLQLFHKKNVIQDFLMYNKFANKKIRKKVILYDRLIIQRKNYNW